MNENKFLFEISWEVCNKVGGIYTVLQSKINQTIQNLGDNYILIGPWREQAKEFVESSSPFLDGVKKVLTAKDIICHVGYWDTPGKPKVILIDFKQRYKIDVLLYSLWVDFGIDSLASNYDYHEPILFSTAAGEVINALMAYEAITNKQVVAHFHEWLCGAGILYLKKHRHEVATVFTAHATVLGRALASENRIVCSLGANFNADDEAHRLGVFAKHSLEKVAVHEADYFTVVSDLVAGEANTMLGKYPDKVIWNGLDVEQTLKKIESVAIQNIRVKLVDIASQVVGRPIEKNALLWVTSGRYEFHNKGYDLLLKSLEQLEGNLPEDASQIVVFFLVAVNWHSKQDSLLGVSPADNPEQRSAIGLATHKIFNPDSDSIIKLCVELNLKNPGRKIHVVFSDAYLNGDDGVFDLTYEQILAACDLSIFPSFYEPWGYTPLESLTYATPTITTDLSGFGCWVMHHIEQDYSNAIFVLARKEQEDTRAATTLNEYLFTVIKKSLDQSYIVDTRKKAVKLAYAADWKNFYPSYLAAYDQAMQFNKLSQAALEITEKDHPNVTSIYENVVVAPRLRSLQYECILPEKIRDLRTLAYNFWWVWHSDAKLLFQKINPVLWEESDHNPVRFLNLVATQDLQHAAENEDYLWLYQRVFDKFNDYIQTDCDMLKFCTNTSISSQHPLAYFCMEYGVDECLPIYSGGLGILAGDYLKAMSDLHVPVVAVGLFYKQGYFLQQVNAGGDQEAMYQTWDPNQIPMYPVNDANGKMLLTSIEVLGRTIYIRAWEVKVGHVSLYLLDTDVPENSDNDRQITDSLYGGSREIRLIQEMVLGIGGTRFLLDKLNIKPALYHLNEGHSAFLLLERIRDLCHQGFNFEEAAEIVRTTSVFTTHTPVAAGNEVFDIWLIKRYLEKYATSRLGISFDRLLDLARDVTNPKETMFSMTALALRLTLSANGVSRLHGKVARLMWQAIWPGMLEAEVPIVVVTNGVHLATWLGDAMRSLYDDYLPAKWHEKQHEQVTWDKVRSIADEEIWRAHQNQKEQLLATVRQLVIAQYTLRNESKKLINATLQCLNKDVLLIGLSRRFTAYKRNNLFLLDKERLAKILTNDKKPAVIIVAGKAHPADVVGKSLIREIIETLRLDMFSGHIIFLEEYNFGLAKLLVQGVDLWLNTPILGREACGTSGMKVGINGGLNFSTRDGWWEEAYNKNVGWQIESLVTIKDQTKRADVENVYLLDTFESEIVPLYYHKGRLGFNPEWIAKIKESIALIAKYYNASRMVREYADNLYAPILLHSEKLMQGGCGDLKAIVNWQKGLVERFSAIKVKAIFINGVKNGKITSHGFLQVKLLLYAGKMGSNELQVEFVLLKNNEHETVSEPTVVHLRCIDVDARASGGILTYFGEYQLADTGFYLYGVRILPYNQMLFRRQDARIVYWG